MKERRNRGDIGENYFPNAVLRQAEIGQNIPKNPPAPGIHQSSLCRRARPKRGRGLGGGNVEILNFPTLPFPIQRLKEHEMLVPRRDRGGGSKFVKFFILVPSVRVLFWETTYCGGREIDKKRYTSVIESSTHRSLVVDFANLADWQFQVDIHGTGHWNRRRNASSRGPWRAFGWKKLEFVAC